MVLSNIEEKYIYSIFYQSNISTQLSQLHKSQIEIDVYWLFFKLNFKIIMDNTIIPSDHNICLNYPKN